MQEIYTTNTPTDGVPLASLAGMKERAVELKHNYLEPAWAQSCNYVRQNPGKAIIFSTMVGVLLGTLLKRRP